VPFLPHINSPCLTVFHVQLEDGHYQAPKHVVVPYVENTLYSTNKYSCVRLYISYFIEHNRADKPHDFKLGGLYFISGCQALHQTSAVLILAVHEANVCLEYSTKQKHVVEKIEQFHK